MNEIRRPKRWTFELDERATGMSLTPTGPTFNPIFATPDTVDLVIDTFDRTTSAPDEVNRLLDMSRKLLSTCVIHYEFAAVAAEKSLQALELATRLRLNAGTRPTFASLIVRLKNESDLTDAEIDLIDTGRIVRNRVFAHPTDALALPLVMMTDVIRSSHQLIAIIFRGPSPTA